MKAYRRPQHVSAKAVPAVRWRQRRRGGGGEARGDNIRWSEIVVDGIAIDVCRSAGGEVSTRTWDLSLLLNVAQRAIATATTVFFFVVFVREAKLSW